MTKFNEIPIYRILPPDPYNEMEGMFCISMVEYPATELDFLQFSNDNNKMSFAVQDKTKHIVSGVSIRCGVPIYRRNGDKEYYVVFQKEDIPLIVEKYMANNFANFVNIQHDESTLSEKDAVMIESFFIDKERGFCPKEFKDVEDGSWCTSFKILNPQLWKLIEDGDVRGFSIELCAGLEKLEPVKLEKQPTEEELMDDEIMKNCFEVSETGTAAELVNKIFEDSIDYDPNVMSEASIRGAIYGHNLVILNYIGTDAPGLRQVTITAYGTLANGPAIRVFQWYGDTSSENDSWKFMLLDDIQGFKVLPIAQDAPAHNLDEGVGGVGHFDVVYDAFEKQ